MSLSPALLAAVHDGTARDRRHHAMRRFTRWWRSRPVVAALLEALDAIDGRDATAAGAVLDAARPLVARTDWIAQAIAGMVRGLRRDPLFEPPFRTVRHEAQQGLALIEHPLLRIAVMVLPADAIAARKVADLGPRAIGFSGQRTLLHFVRAGDAAIDLWEVDPAGADFSTANPGRCRPAGRRALADGTMLRMDGSRQAWTFARAPADILLVHASARIGAAPFLTEYDAATGAFLNANAGDTATSRLQLIAAMLGRMGRRDAAPALAAIARDGPFALRWQMARKLAALDARAALPLVRGMAARDPHPEVRAAARATLVLLAA